MNSTLLLPVYSGTSSFYTETRIRPVGFVSDSTDKISSRIPQELVNFCLNIAVLDVGLRDGHALVVLDRF